MNRVEDAIQKGRCVIAFGGRTLAEDNVLVELRRRSGIPAVMLGGDAVQPAQALSAEAIAPATASQGGILVLIEPDAGTDGRALESLGGLLKAAPNKPRVHIVARAFNPFLLPMSMRLLKLDQHKVRAKDFMARLPMVAPGGPAPDKKKAKKQKSGPRAPRIEFIGREEELAELAHVLSEPGPVAVVGHPGVGRTWLVEKALEASELRRLPDFLVEDGSGFDTLAARIAEASGDDAVKKLVRSGERAPMDVIEGLTAAMEGEAFENTAMVFRNLRYLQHPDGSIARRDRLSLFVMALLSRPTQCRVVFVTDRKPALYGDGQTAAIRVVALGGLRGKDLHAIWEAYGASEVDRAKMGQVFSTTGGHALANRAFAIAWAGKKDDGLIDGKKFLKLTERNVEPLSRHLMRRVEKLPSSLSRALATAAHASLPVSGRELSELGLNRERRTELLVAGLLDALPVGEPREYRVHPLVRRTMHPRALSDFDTLEVLGRLQRQRAEAAEGVDALAWHQRANRTLTAARRRRGLRDVGYPDNDGALDSVRGILRNQKNPRFDVALQIIRPVRRSAPRDPEAACLEAWVLHYNDKTDEAEAVFADARTNAATPEVFHTEASWRLERRQKGDVQKAAEALQAGTAVFPGDGTLWRRLGAIQQVELNRQKDAEASFRKSLEVEPGAPEAWSRLGEVLLAQGPDRHADAEQAIRYALGLEPERPTHGYRLARLLRRRALVAEDAETRAALNAEAKAGLEKAVQAHPRNPGPYLELAELLLELGESLDRAEWCARKAAKIRKTPAGQVLKARILARTGRTAEAEAAIQRLAGQKGSQHQAHAALSELFFAQRKVFAADQELHKAIQLCPESSPAFSRYKLEKARLELLISSGQATEIERQADQEQTAIADAAAAEVKTTHDRGTVVRRKGKKDKGDVVVGDLGSQTVPLKQAQETPVEAQEIPVEETPVEAQEIPVEETPVEAQEPPVEETPVEETPVEAQETPKTAPEAQSAEPSAPEPVEEA
ncbi:MAG TPA: hypothetical protein QGF58_03250 [Myxococcota bacterium]|nr:hypothetical protein [Myxococcota bacterium]